MQTFETTATVEEQGQVHVTGVPFGPGTRVEVTITVTEDGAGTPSTESDRAARLFRALDKARNTESVGALRRDEIYDRDILR